MTEFNGQLRRFPRRRSQRHGTAAVEFAVACGPLFLLIFASIEFARAFLAAQSLDEAARIGARRAILRGATTQEIEAEIAPMLATVGITTYTVNVDPDPGNAQQWDPVTVTVDAAFADMSWLPLPQFVGDLTWTASCVLPREALTEN